MRSAITAIGTANPRYKCTQSSMPELLATAFKLKPAERRLLKSIYKSTGIEYRYSVLSDYQKKLGEFEFFPNHVDRAFPLTAVRMNVYKENALTLALAAIDNFFASHPSFHKEDITHLITISCTGMYAPGIDIEIVEQLNLDTSTQRTAINFMGCYGTFNGLKVADAICRADPASKVLVVSVELCTLHFQRDMSLDNMISNAIFSDGAGAMLVEGKPASAKYFCLNSFYCDLLPQSSEQMAWHILDLSKEQLLLASIDYYAIHPGGVKILQASEESLNTSEEQNRHSYHVLRHYGNMSSTTIMFVLKEIWNTIERAEHDKTIFSCAFGPGLTLESMLLRTHYV